MWQWDKSAKKYHQVKGIDVLFLGLDKVAVVTIVLDNFCTRIQFLDICWTCFSNAIQIGIYKLCVCAKRTKIKRYLLSDVDSV